MASETTCGWYLGDRWPAEGVCGRPAKARTDSKRARNGLVCGTHSRSAKVQGATVTDLPGPCVRVGQVWQDADPRTYGRHLRVAEVDSTHATVVHVDIAGRPVGRRERITRIRLDRFRPTSTGYRLVTDVPKEG